MKRLSLKTLLLLACVAACARGAAAQGEPCRLERAVAPDYGGVMLGMTAGELARMFPGSDELQRAAVTSGTKQFVASLGMLELGVRREHFADAAEMLLTFLDGRLHRIDVRYRRPVPWKNAAEFSEQASKRLAVPADAWGAVSSDADKFSRVLDCRGFSVVVRIDRAGPSTLSIVDTAAAKQDSGAAAPAKAEPPAKPRRGARKKQCGKCPPTSPAPGQSKKGGSRR
ncbi:MAG: hypothetical protein LC795_14060 [Acidobacteria bacterium]|nr:hypothetical protein [Acidobacteriota bacterium]MCA1620403.1 hypothetical protein [Acidobacteriota bacterium]